MLVVLGLAGVVVVSRPEADRGWRPFVLLDGEGVTVGSYPTFSAAHEYAHDPATLSVYPRPLIIVKVPSLRLWKIDATGCVELAAVTINPGWRCPRSRSIRRAEPRAEGERRHA